MIREINRSVWVFTLGIWATIGCSAAADGDPSVDSKTDALSRAAACGHRRYGGHGEHCDKGHACPPPVQQFCGGIAGISCPGGGACVDDPSDSCDPAKGGADCGGICSCVETVLCIQGSHFDSSPAVCACVPDADPCASVRCAAGTHCVASGSSAACQPDAVTCGGIAARPCPGSGRCADDPNDNCDPANGGADCGGICSCIETVLFVQGPHFDCSPAVCACVVNSK